MIERYQADSRDLQRIYSQEGSAARKEKLESFYASQTKLLEAVAFENLSHGGKVDYVLFANHLDHQKKEMALDAQHEAEIAPLVSYQATIIALEEARRRMETIEPRKSAETLTTMQAEIGKTQAAMPTPKPSAGVLARAATRVGQLRQTLHWWHDFYDLYDPQFAWWTDSAYKQVDTALEQHLHELQKAAGIKPPAENAEGPGGEGRGGRNSDEPAPPPETGDLAGVGPAGRDALIEALRYNLVAYTPEELVAIANKEFAWCDREMLRASHELGFGDDWKKALEKVKNDYVEPGKMIYLVRDQQAEAMKFIDAHQLVTIPPLVREDWWEEAMTPRMQLVNPFFTGGDVIHVSSPASSQTTEERLEATIFISRAEPCFTS
jgi:Bacterial protein of unknown function (DUF885)